MLLSKSVKVRWNGSTRKWYEGKGYIWTNQNDWFDCDIKDVMTTSPIKVIVKCDYCSNIFEKPYRDLFKQRELVSKDCCSNRKCMVAKGDEVNIIKYGVKNHMQTQESKDRLSINNRTNWNDVVKAFELKGLELVSTKEDYKNDRSRLNYICTSHRSEGVQETNYQNVKSQKHCCRYGSFEAVSDIKRADGKDVYNDFINQGLIPMFDPNDYINNSQSLPYMCPKHKDEGIQYRQYSNLKNTKGCWYCAKESTGEQLKLDKDYVFNYFNNRGLNVLDDEYVNKDNHINFECIHHKGIIQKVTYNGLKRTKEPCYLCREEKSLNKLSRKVRASLSWWRKYSNKIFNNSCILTGIKGSIEIHHQYQLDNIIKDVLLELNIEIKDKYSAEEIILIKNKVSEFHKDLPIGVCLNKQLHILFHIKYGKKDCSKDIFDIFIDKYFNGEYDNELNEDLKSINSKTNLEEAKRLASLFYVEKY